jgi:predicted metal-dependent hydrolase
MRSFAGTSMLDSAKMTMRNSTTTPMPEPSQAVQYGTTTIHYRLEHRERRTLGIEVHPDGQVRVIAPEDAAIITVQARVLKRAGWILKQQREFASYPPPQPARKYVSGESHRYLGKQYRLCVTIGKPEQVKLSRGFLNVTATEPDRVQALLERWFRARAEAVFSERIAVCLERVSPFGVIHPGDFKLKRMEKRWGSCTADGTIYLNPYLIGAPKECIDYVITHELIHTVHLHHKRRFYALLSRCFPDWQTVRTKLNVSMELPHVNKMISNRD